MTNYVSIILHNEVQGHEAFAKAWRICKAHLNAGRKIAVTAKETKRTTEQNSLFHAICGDIAKSGTKWAGKARSAQQWKVLLVSGHAVATKEDSEIVPGLEHEFINIRESTALMSIKRGASLITYTLAFCDLNGIKVKDDCTDLRLAE